MHQRTIPAPALASEIEKTEASVDTVELFMRRPPRGLRKHLDAAKGERITIKDCYDRTGRWQGVRVIVNRPNRAVIKVMARLVADSRLWCCVSRVDVAVDFYMSSRQHAEALARWLKWHLILKWRSPRGKKRESDRDSFWVIWADDHRPRDLVVYIKSGNRVRMELKFQSPVPVRRAGLDDLIELENLDVQGLFRHNIKAERLTDQHVASVIRKTKKQDMVRHRASRRRDHPVTDQYRSKIVERVRAMLSRLDMQEVRPTRGVETVCMHWLGIPERPRLP